ncbi:MAG: FAD-dependent oxidoreductase [Verrucomicrobia bacterium]|nr:FAD-dependent oxidoreductase [Verrucomicrobiota bacterium]
MSNPTIENVVIIGTGCAGLTAAIYTARASLNPLVLEGPQPGGQLTTTSEVENFPGFPHGVDGFQLTQNMREQATRFGARFEQLLVDRVDLSTQPRQVVAGDRTILAKTLIIATGASPRMTGVPGEKELYGGKGVTTCATCDVAVEGVAQQAVSGLRVKNVKTGAEAVLPVKGVFVAIGHVPNTRPFAPPLEVDAAGYFKTVPGSQVQTSVPGVYVAGDCVDHVYRQAITAAGMGCAAAIEAERWLAEHGG